MGKKIALFFATAILTFANGCIGPNPFFPTTEQKLDKAHFNEAMVAKDISEQTKQFVTGAKGLLEDHKGQIEKFPPQEDIALDFVVQAERLLGGEPIEKIDVQQLMEIYETDIASYKSIMKKRENAVTSLRKNEESYRAEIDAFQKQIEREKSRSKGFFGWLKGASRSFVTLMVIIIILMVIFCPALLTRVIGWLLAKLPSLIGFFGITSVRVARGIVKGVQDARVEVAELADDKKLSKKEIWDLLEKNLKIGADQETQKTVDFLKKNMRLPSATKLFNKISQRD